jgi:hypothetical protein
MAPRGPPARGPPAGRRLPTTSEGPRHPATATTLLLTLLGSAAAAAAILAAAVSSSAASPSSPSSAAAALPPPLFTTPFTPNLLLEGLGRPLPPRPSEEQCQVLLQRYLVDLPAEPVPYRRPMTTTRGSGGGGSGSGAIDDDEAAAPPPPAAPRLFFLHMPRTAGRTVNFCLLVQGTEPRWRCPRAYAGVGLGDAAAGGPPAAAADAAGGDPAASAAANAAAAHRRCHLLSSHDDFSLVQALLSSEAGPGGGVAAVTQLRDPVERLLSSYEWATLHALNLAKLSREEEQQLDRLGEEQGRLDTFVTRVWPWSELVPVLVEDVRRRRRRRREEQGKEEEEGAGASASAAASNSSSGAISRSRNPYDSPDVSMPLAEFVRLPIARDLLFEGQAMQLLGLTANSRWPHAESLRACALRPPLPTTEATGATTTTTPHSSSSSSSSSSTSTTTPTPTTWPVRDALERVAAARLARFAHVGVAERLRESAEAAAAALGLDVREGAAYGRKGTALDYDDDDDDDDDEDGEVEGKKTKEQNKKPKFEAQLQPLPLGQAFLKCAARYREADKRSARAAMESVPVAPGKPPMRPFSEREGLGGAAAGGGAASGASSSSSSSSSSTIAATAAARRAMIPQELLAWLGAQNRMDSRLHSLAAQALDASRARWRAEGKLLEMAVEDEVAAREAAEKAGAGPLLKAMQAQADEQRQEKERRQQERDRRQAEAIV